MQFLDIEVEHFRITDHNRAIEMVGSSGILLTFVPDAGHEDEIDIAVEKIHDVPMAELCRIAHTFGGHRFDSGLVGGLLGLLTQDHRESQLREECVPEGIVLIHIQDPRQADRWSLRLFWGQRNVGILACTLKQATLLIGEQIGQVGYLWLDARALLTTIACDETTLFAGLWINTKTADSEQAGI